MEPAVQSIHATAVCIDGKGVLLIGPSGSGKSNLALRLIDRGAILICDDRVIVDTENTPPTLRQAPNIAGMLEVRGLGIVKLPSVTPAPLHLCVMVGSETMRMPDEDVMHVIDGVSIPSINVNTYSASAPIIVELALKSITR